MTSSTVRRKGEDAAPLAGLVHRQLLEIVAQRGGAVGVALDDVAGLQTLADKVAGAGALQGARLQRRGKAAQLTVERAGGGERAAQRRVELMRDAGHQPPQRGHFFRLHQLLGRHAQFVVGMLQFGRALLNAQFQRRVQLFDFCLARAARAYLVLQLGRAALDHHPQLADEDERHQHRQQQRPQRPVVGFVVVAHQGPFLPEGAALGARNGGQRLVQQGQQFGPVAAQAQADVIDVFRLAGHADIAAAHFHQLIGAREQRRDHGADLVMAQQVAAFAEITDGDDAHGRPVAPHSLDDAGAGADGHTLAAQAAQAAGAGHAAGRKDDDGRGQVGVADQHELLPVRCLGDGRQHVHFAPLQPAHGVGDVPGLYQFEAHAQQLLDAAHEFYGDTAWLAVVAGRFDGRAVAVDGDADHRVARQPGLLLGR
jgi:hypothetical protein